MDAIERTPGMVIWSNGGKGSVSSLSARGTESNHTTFFLDGRRMNPGFGNQYDLAFLSLSNLESVEIQKGASSVNYGSSGIGGVVHSRLRSGLGVTEPESSVFVEGGSNDTIGSGFTAVAGSDKMGFSLAGSGLQTDNERDNDDYAKLDLSSRFDLELTDYVYFEVLGMIFDTDKELPGPLNNPTPFDEQDTTSWLISPGLSYKTDKLSAHLFYARSERESDIFEVNSAFDNNFNYIGDFPISNEIEVDTDEVHLQADYSISNEALLTFGATYRNDNVVNTNIDTFDPLGPPNPYEESFQQWGGYGQLVWQLSESVELRGGFRYDDYSDYDDETTGSATLIYYLDTIDAAVFAKYGTSYAPPSAVDLAYDRDRSTELDAEQSRSYEFGFRHSLMEDKLSYSVVLFRNEIDELLSFNPADFDTINEEQAVTEGVEFSTEYQATEKLTLGLGYTYLMAVSDKLNDPRTGGFVADPADDVPLARRPKHLLQLTSAYQFTESLSVGLQGVGQFDREDIDPQTFLQVSAEDYFVVRMVVDLEIDENWSLYGRVENLLDESYASAAGFPALGRSGYLGVKYTF